jgi:hypothetical protein
MSLFTATGHIHVCPTNCNGGEGKLHDPYIRHQNWSKNTQNVS